MVDPILVLGIFAIVYTMYDIFNIFKIKNLPIMTKIMTVVIVFIVAFLIPELRSRSNTVKVPN